MQSSHQIFRIYGQIVHFVIFEQRLANNASYIILSWVAYFTSDFAISYLLYLLDGEGNFFKDIFLLQKKYFRSLQSNFFLIIWNIYK